MGIWSELTPTKKTFYKRQQRAAYSRLSQKARSDRNRVCREFKANRKATETEEQRQARLARRRVRDKAIRDGRTTEEKHVGKGT